MELSLLYWSSDGVVTLGQPCSDLDVIDMVTVFLGYHAMPPWKPFVLPWFRALFWLEEQFDFPHFHLVPEPQTFWLFPVLRDMLEIFNMESDFGICTVL